MTSIATNGGHTPECEGSCHPSCPIGQERSAEAGARAARAQARWDARRRLGKYDPCFCEGPWSDIPPENRPDPLDREHDRGSWANDEARCLYPRITFGTPVDERAARRLDRRINAYSDAPSPSGRRLVIEAERLYRHVERGGDGPFSEAYDG